MTATHGGGRHTLRNSGRHNKTAAKPAVKKSAHSPKASHSRRKK